MDNLSDRIAEILQDPDRLKQITDMASSIGLSMGDNAPTDDSVPLKSTLEQVSQIIHQAETTDSRHQTLVQALLPYLNPRRQARLERAMQVLQVSRLAGTALQGYFPFAEHEEAI